MKSPTVNVSCQSGYVTVGQIVKMDGMKGIVVCYKFLIRVYMKMIFRLENCTNRVFIKNATGLRLSTLQSEFLVLTESRL